MTVHSRGKATRSHNWRQREEMRQAQFDYIRDGIDPGWREREAARDQHFKYLRAWTMANFRPIVDRFGEQAWKAFWIDGVFGEDPNFTYQEQRAILNVVDAVGIGRFFSVFVELGDLEGTTVLLEGVH